MSGSADETIAAARAAYQRITGVDYAPVLARRRRRRGGGLRKRLTRIAAVDAAILLTAAIVGLFVPLGLFGALGVMMLLIAATLLLAQWPAERAPAPERLREADVRALPAQTVRWLDAQRPALPAPARTLVDQIGVRLDTLGAQVAGLDANAPAAAEVRKLVGEQLPEFVRGYQKVPASLRGVPRNGRTPDAQLVDGLKLIDGELAGMSEQLAQGDLDALATRGRYLEIRYRGDGAEG